MLAYELKFDTENEEVQEFNGRNFALVKYADAKGEKRDCYAMTRQGFYSPQFCVLLLQGGKW